jgi:pyruvate/2-oxoglutarate dehydrogenase complex dihydrolipoamide dehydrogenase (E3) component
MADADEPGPELRPDICVIGAGAAGLSVAMLAATFGVPVVLVEKAAMGGQHLNGGAVPTAALRAAGAVAEGFRSATPFGIAAARPRVDSGRVRDHVADVIAARAANDSAGRLTAMGVTVLRGEARFIDPRTVEVDGRRIRARRFVLATGSRPAMPDMTGLAGTRFLTPDTVHSLDSRPDRLAILGGETAGLELAQAFRHLGSDVTVIAPGALLDRSDPELASVVLTALRREGVVLREHARVDRVEETAEGVRIMLMGGEAVVGSRLLVAAGRQPVVEELGLDAAGVAHGPDGVKVDAGLRTSNRRVYAIGACTAGPEIGDASTHAVRRQAELVLRNALFRSRAKADSSAVPRLVHTDPELAEVGMTEAQARATGARIRILRHPFADTDRAQAERRSAGLVKAVVDRKGRILGAGIAGPGAGELIVPWALAIQRGLDISAIRDLVVPSLTFSEASRRAALAFYADLPRRPMLGRLVRFLRLFG